MNLSKYDILLKTIELGSFTKVADHIGYTQSAVSQVIHSLENELGTVLLLRSRSGVSLTTEGEILLPYIQNIINDHHALAEQINQLHGLVQGTIRIGSFHSIGCYILPPLIKGFQELYPNITFEISEGDFTEVEEGLSAGQFDIGLFAIQNITNFETITLKKDKLFVILPEDHPLAGEPFFPIESLKNEPFIYLDEGNDNDSQIIFKANHISPNIKYSSKEDNTVLSMVENGLGIAILPELVVSRTSFRVIPKRTAHPYYRTLGIAVKDRKRTSIAVREFISYTQKQYTAPFGHPT